MTLYHGTDAKYTKSILQEGLIPKKAPGADTWAMKNDIGIAINALLTPRKPSVFLTKYLGHAAEFSNYAALGNSDGDRGVLFRVTIPATAEAKLKKDELDHWAYRFEGQIPPEWITLVEEFPVLSKADLAQAQAA